MCCEGDRDYVRAWQGLWPSKQTIIGIEHDMEASDDLIAELLECPAPMCTHAYRLHHLPRAHYAQRDGGPGFGEWVAPGVAWCGYSGIGFCKIAPEARVRPLAERPWQEVDCGIYDATDAPWHVHWQQGPDGQPVGVTHHHV